VFPASTAARVIEIGTGVVTPFAQSIRTRRLRVMDEAPSGSPSTLTRSRSSHRCDLPPMELWRLRGSTDELRGLACETSFGYALGLELDAELVLFHLQPTLDEVIAYADRIQAALTTQGWRVVEDSSGRGPVRTRQRTAGRQVRGASTAHACRRVQRHADGGWRQPSPAAAETLQEAGVYDGGVLGCASDTAQIVRVRP
jgi:hypothetical protein